MSLYEHATFYLSIHQLMDIAKDCTFVFPPNSHVEALTPNVTVVGHGAFEK